ncbi:MAG TPA: winged helix-turn-helix domain-containing protein [Terriglobia bacterium]|nr:winged helix-turn-helix domain-containing protein [Terriglobia bacterium]
MIRFGIFEADLSAGELRRNGHKVRIQDLPFRALAVLLGRPGEVISREEFRQSLWPADVHVDFEQGISSAIKRLRDALGDSADNPIFIQTIERRGYRWIAPVISSAPATPGAEALPPPVAPAVPEVDSGSIPAPAVVTPERRRLSVVLLVLGAVAVLGVSGLLLLRSLHPGRPAPISSIAVLPFDNLSAPDFDDAFSEGLTDEVTAGVSRLDGIRVTGRRSAYVFKGKHNDLRDIGSRLNVEAVVDGSVQRVGDRTHVTVELSRTRDGFAIWSQTYDTTSANWIQIESDIATSISHALARNLNPGTTSPGPRDPEAHALYLQGRYQWNQRNLQAELKSVDLMQQAIAREPDYALAWTGLADSLAVIGDNEDVDPSAYMPRARDAALKALQLDPSLAEAHAVLGMVACHYDYDWPTAEREYKKAFELNPSYASAHQYYALGLMAHGRFAEAEEQLSTARHLDPLALIIDVDLALLRKYQRDYDGVIAVSQSVLKRDPNFQLGYSMLAIAYYCEHRWGEWRAVDKRAPMDDLTRALANGQPERARHCLEQYVQQARAGVRRPYDVVGGSLKVGDRDQALNWLEKSYQHHDYWMLFINVDPEMDPVRSDPRFQAIVKRLGVG